MALFDEWGETDRSHRKLDHRGSYLRRVWVSASSVTSVIHLRETRSWMINAAIQVEVGFTDALQIEGLLDAIERRADGLVDLGADDQIRPILLAVSDNGPQMTSGSTREFMALCAIAQHFGRPGTPTDQAWIESFNGHLKTEFPHLLAITDPATLRAELAVTREFWNAVRLHAGIGYVTPNDEHQGRGEAIRKARQAGLEQARNRRLAWHRQQRHTQPIQDPDKNKLHWVRDVTYAEDHSQIGAGPQVMASLRNTAISVLRLNGHTNIAAALRHHARNHLRPVKLLLNW